MNGLLTIFKKKDISSSCLKRLSNKGLDSLSHRGSNARTLFLMNRNLQYVREEAPTRLAMGICSQLSSARHIASSEAGILFFNGRLINKKELCDVLSIPTGNETTDADIVLRMFKQQHVNCFSLLKGFWSLIYLDKENKIIYGARDHFGNRPLWFCNTGDHFVFASESRTIYSLFDDTRSINRNTIIDFLLWGNIGTVDQYFFNDIHSIEPSHYVKYEIESDRMMVERYYTLPYDRSKTSYNESFEKQFITKLRDHIIDSVCKNLSIFDGTLAIGLSGGMDSSSLLCLAKMIEPERTFVAYTTTDNYGGGEIDWAEKVVRHTRAEWVKVACTGDHIIEQLEAVNRVHSAPVYNASSFTQFRVMEEVKKHGQAVIIDGQGGDEMLGGYPAYFPLFLQSLRKNGEWRRWRMELMQTGNTGLSRNELVMRRLKMWAKEHYYTQIKLAQQKRKHAYASLMPEIRDAYFNAPPLVAPLKKEVLNDALYESYTLFLDNLIRWSEQSAASQGVESVMPLSNHPDLTEFVFSIPSSFKIHNGWNKYLLRKAMTGIVPDEICMRKQKMGFYYPEQQWLGEMKNAMLSTIQTLDDPEECIRKKYILENSKKLFVSTNPLFQQFIFRCYSYLIWRNNL